MLESYDLKVNSSEELGESHYYFELICRSKDYNMSIYVHSDINDTIYFKVFNNYHYIDATKCCRVKVFKCGYRYNPSDSPMEKYILSDIEKSHMIDMLNSKYTSTPRYDQKGKKAWEVMLSIFIDKCTSLKIRKMLKKRINKMPDYMNLPDYI